MMCETLCALMNNDGTVYTVNGEPACFLDADEAIIAADEMHLEIGCFELDCLLNKVAYRAWTKPF